MEYRLGRLNTVADALSCWDVKDGVAAAQEGAAATDLALSGPTFVLLDTIRQAIVAAHDAQRLLE
jgi:hypothetical protein